MSDRVKRILAYLIDMATLLPLTLVSLILADHIWQQSSFSPAILLIPLISLLAMVLFVGRDLIFKGRSLGKRILGLCVYDKTTLKKASAKQCILRNMFFFVYFIDGIILLTTGESLGDRAASTAVLSQESLKTYGTSSDYSRQLNPKALLIIPVAIIGFMVFVFGIVLMSLNAEKDSQEYQLAYDYLISSEAFAQLNAEESQIFMNQYSSTPSRSAEDDSISRTTTFGFLVNFRSFEVVCHKENDVWRVCEECTTFD